MEPEILCQDGRDVLIQDSVGNYFEIVIDHSDEIEALEGLLSNFIMWFNTSGNRLIHSIDPIPTWERYLRKISPWSYLSGPSGAT